MSNVECQMFYVFLFVFGLLVGSFINVVTLRYQPGRKLFDFKILGGRSHCPACGQKLNWYELAPIFSFLIQKRRCRRCGEKISWQYPLVEILSGIIFVAVPWHFFNLQSITQLPNYQLPITIIWILIFLLFLILAVIDFRHYLIPDEINLSLAILGIILIIFQSSIFQSSFLGHYSLLFDFPLLSSLSSSIWLNHIFAVVLAMLIFGAIIVFTRGKAMGWGDFKLAGALGLVFGWPDVIMVIALSFIVGTISVIPLLIKGAKGMKDVVPFGPFLAVAAVLVFSFGFQIVDGYFKLFGIIL